MASFLLSSPYLLQPKPSRIFFRLNMILRFTHKYLIYNKASGIVCDGFKQNSLIPTVAAEFRAMKVSTKTDIGQFKTVHRLDKYVLGALIVAREQNFARKLSNAFAGKPSPYKMIRRYVGLLPGTQYDVPTKGTIYDRVAIFKDGQEQHPVEGITHYKLLPLALGITPVVFELETGRKNQIRSHCLSYFGTTLLKDDEFEAFRRGEPTSTPSQIALHSAYLRLENTNRTMEELLAPIPVPDRELWRGLVDRKGYFHGQLKDELINFKTG